MVSRITMFGLSALVLGIASAHAGERCTALADGRTGKVLVQEGICDQRLTPASTFKIPISLMGFDAGFLVDDHAPVLPFREGYPDWIESWKAPTDPQGWMKNSAVWYSQRITQHLGTERFENYIRLFKYGNEDVSGNPGRNDGLTQAWLTSSLRISPGDSRVFVHCIEVEARPPPHHAGPQAREAMARRLPVLLKKQP